jgi:hypothetical protein
MTCEGFEPNICNGASEKEPPSRRTYFIALGDEHFDDHVAELDVDDGGHGLLLRAQQRRSEADAQIAHRHQICRRHVRHSEGEGMIEDSEEAHLRSIKQWKLLTFSSV